MSVDLDWPRDGLPELLDTAAGFTAAARALAAGIGPIAVDTERASGFRYDDRAFLLQLRRKGTGTILLDPEGHRSELTAALAPVLNSADWILHAAASDLPSLALLGFHPARLFDTEKAGRLSGFDRVNLATMIEELFGYRLTKGYGAADWSRRPLPGNWLAYAALDVELLLDLGEVMAELLDNQGKLELAEEEFDHLVRAHSAPPAPTTWRTMKGVTALRRPEQLNAARHLWQAREEIAVSEDRAVSRILPNKVLLEIARTLPTSRRDLGAVRGFPARQRGAVNFWFEELRRARTTPPSAWPQAAPARDSVPSTRVWKKEHPDSWAAYEHARDLIAVAAAELSIPSENVIRPALVREAVWEIADTGAVGTFDELTRLLEDRGARDWQIRLAAPVIRDALS